MRVGPKFDAFLNHHAEAEFLEGTTQAGKTTVGVFKFLLEVAESPKRQHIIAGLDKGTLEKNIIEKDAGVLDEWGILVTYNGGGTSRDSLPHILFWPEEGVEKIIYVLGYDDKSKWKKVLGGQYGCIYIDEINVAHIDFVREASMRCDYLMGTLNPDDPALPIYEEYINRSRPLPEWEADTPAEIMSELNQEPQPGWTHWFFTFDDNITLTEEKKQRTIRSVPPGTKQYKNKIEGIRCRATGLVFGNFEYRRNVRTRAWVKAELKKRVYYQEGHAEAEKGFKFKLFTIGVDTSYSEQSEDTITFSFEGITDTGILITLDEEELTNRDAANPLAPSDIVKRLVAFADRNKDSWGFARYIFIDSADQATIQEAKKYKRQTGCVYEFNPSYKKMKIIDRIILQRGWIQDGCYIVLDHCTGHIRELNRYSYDDNGNPEDRNDHTINANQYGWLPYVRHIGAR